MNYLAIDTISRTISVTAAGPQGKCTVVLEGKTQHAETILALMQTALDHAGFTPQDTDTILCAEGPGSFTGLRIAYAAAKGIQLAAQCELRPVPTLPCFAWPFRSWKGNVLAVLDAKKERFYAQSFTDGQETGNAQDASAEEIINQLDCDTPLLITGPDADLFAESLMHSGDRYSITVIPFGTTGISREMIEIALQNAHEYTDTISDYAGPRYIRKSDAETAG